MRILVLEDSHERITKFKRGLIGHSVTYVETYEEATEIAITDSSFNLYLLDHDLHPTHYNMLVGRASPDEIKEAPPTGDDFAEFIRDKLPENKRPQAIIIHSMNDPGSHNMYLKLTEAKIPVFRISFAYFELILKALEEIAQQI